MWQDTVLSRLVILSVKIDQICNSESFSDEKLVTLVTLET